MDFFPYRLDLFSGDTSDYAMTRMYQVAYKMQEIEWSVKECGASPHLQVLDDDSDDDNFCKISWLERLQQY